MIGKDRQRLVIGVKVLERVANRLGTSIHLVGQLPRHFGKTRTAFDQLAGPFDHLALFVVSELTESFSAANLVAVVRDKSLDAAVQETDPFATAEQQPTADQTRHRANG